MQRLRPILACLLVVCGLVISSRAHAAGPVSAQALGPDGGWITTLAVSPAFADDGRAWAGAFGGRIFATADGAATWTESHDGETDPVVAAVAASPSFSRDATVFAAADDGVFRSTDAGSTWATLSAGLGGHACRALAVSPSFATDSTLYVATDAGVYRSTDRGASWLPPRSGGRSTISVLLIPGSGPSPTLAAGLDGGGLETSGDGGVTWQTVNGFPSLRRVLSLAVVRIDGGLTLVAGTDDGIWVSSDGGGQWTQSAGAGDRIDALAVGVPGEPGRVYAGSASGKGVYRSDDGGRTWRSAGAPALPFVTALAVGPTGSGEEILAGSAGRGVFASVDGGATWRADGAGLHGAQIAGLSTFAGGLIAGGNGGAQTLDPGSGTWRRPAVGSDFVTAVAGAGEELFVGTQDEGIWHSSDGGATGTRTTAGTGPVGALGVSATFGADRTLFAATDYVYRSSDGGASFQKASGMAGNDVRCFGFSPAFDADGTAFAGTVGHGLFRTTDGGLTWQLSGSGLPADPITAILPSATFSVNRTVYAATAGDGVFVSTDGGVIWTAASPQVPNVIVGALAWTRSGDLLAGTERGVFQEGPSGWSRLGGSWDGYVSALVDSVQGSDETLYAGTTGQGVWGIALSSSVTTPTGTASPATTPTASPTVGPTATSTPRPLHVHLSVLPDPAVSGQPAVVLIRGPSKGAASVYLTATRWERAFTTVLGRDGRLALGFVAPSSRLMVDADVQGRGQTAHVTLSVPVVSH